MKNNTTPPADKRSLIIGAILNKDTEKLKQLSAGNNKRVVLLDTFLDCLIWGSNGGFEDSTITFVQTDRYKQMWEELEINSLLI